MAIVLATLLYAGARDLPEPADAPGQRPDRGRQPAAEHDRRGRARRGHRDPLLRADQATSTVVDRELHAPTSTSPGVSPGRQAQSVQVDVELGRSARSRSCRPRPRSCRSSSRTSEHEGRCRSRSSRAPSPDGPRRRPADAVDPDRDGLAGPSPTSPGSSPSGRPCRSTASGIDIDQRRRRSTPVDQLGEPVRPASTSTRRRVRVTMLGRSRTATTATRPDRARRSPASRRPASRSTGVTLSPPIVSVEGDADRPGDRRQRPTPSRSRSRAGPTISTRRSASTCRQGVVPIVTPSTVQVHVVIRAVTGEPDVQRRDRR